MSLDIAHMSWLPVSSSLLSFSFREEKTLPVTWAKFSEILFEGIQR
jgi:hypothetical protein